MKTASRFFWGMLSVLALCIMSSCDKEEKEFNEKEAKIEALKDVLSEAKYEIVSTEKYTLTEMADLLYGKPESGFDTSDPDNAREKFIKRNQEIIDSYIKDNQLDGNFAPYFETFEFNYWSTDQMGNPIELSAFMSAGSYLFDYTDQDHIYLVCPYTHTKEDECATKNGGGKEFLAFLSIDNLFIMPDGQGFGTDAGNVQPYIDHNTQAKQIYDALAAGYRLYTNTYEGEMEDDWTLRVIGASQGAGDAMAVHKYLDTNTVVITWPWGNVTVTYTLGQLLCFEYSYVCCGPYDPVATMEHYYSTRELEYPVVVPMVIKSMLGCNPDLAKKYKESDFYTDEYNKHKAEYDKLYAEKSTDADGINEKMAKDFNTESDKKILADDDHVFIERILNSTVMDKNSEICKDFMACLKKQDLTTGWKPITKTYLYSSKGDKIVPPINTTELAELFNSCGVFCDVDWEMTDQGHIFTCGKFMGLSW